MLSAVNQGRFDMKYDWQYLLDPIMDRRYQIVERFIQSGDRILDVGTVRSSLRNTIGSRSDVEIVSCDIAAKLEQSPHPNDTHARQPVSVVSRSLIGGRPPSVVVVLGMNLVGPRPASDAGEFEALVKLLISARLFVIEYPVNFWRARLEAEAAVSLTRPKILYEETLDYSQLLAIPPHASLRRLIVGASTTAFDLTETQRLFTSVFSRFASGNFVSESNSEFTFEGCNGVTVHEKRRGIKIKTTADPWSYLLVGKPLRPPTSPTYVGLEISGKRESVNICAGRGDELIFESSLADAPRGVFGFLLNEGEHLLFRAGPKGGALNMTLRIVGQSPC